MAYNFPIGTGGKPAAKPMEKNQEPDGDEMGGEAHHPAIHEHLQNMHAQTGEAHSHIEHHSDGTATTHHVSKEGEVSGPDEHNTAEEAKNALDQFFEEESQEPQHAGKDDWE